MDFGEGPTPGPSKNPFAQAHADQVQFQRQPQQQPQPQQQQPAQSSFQARSNSITGSSAPGSPTRSFSSFLSRATSVTTSSVTDRLGGAVGSMKSAVGSLSSQLQHVPTNIERFSGGVTSSIGQQFAATSPSSTGQQLEQMGPLGAPIGLQQQQPAQQQQPMNQPSVMGQQTGATSRHRTLLVIDGYHTDWSKYFKKAYQRSSFAASGTPSATASLLSSFASVTDSASGQELLVEQADFREISVASNSYLAGPPTVYINSSRTSKSTRTVKPDYVLIRQRTKDRLDHFKNIVIGLNYGFVPMLETIDTWHIFQDKGWTFSHLAQIQQRLGRDQFTLIPQIYCQTHQELVQQINGAAIVYPCLVRLGPSGRGKIKADNGQMLLELASIVAMSKCSCTIEPFIDARCDLLVQKIGQRSLKAYIRRASQTNSEHVNLFRRTSWNRQQQQANTGSVGSSIFATLQSTAGGTFGQAFGQTGGASQQPSGAGSGKQQIINYEPVHLSDRYKRWVEAVSEHFPELEMFSIKALINNKDDKEYIIGMSDCAMDLISDTLEEDRRNIAEMVVGHMGQALKKQAGSLQAPTREQQLQQQPAPQQSRVPSLTGRSQSVSVGSDTGLTRPPLPRRGSREPASSAEPPSKDSLMGSASNSIGNLTNVGTSGEQGGQQRQSVSSFMDQTQSAAANALSSFQNRSMNFFRRLDSRQESFSSLLGSATSGSQDKLANAAEPDPFAPVSQGSPTPAPTTTSTISATGGGGSSGPPPKPPPPANRAPSLAGLSNDSMQSDSAIRQFSQDSNTQSMSDSTLTQNGLFLGDGQQQSSQQQQPELQQNAGEATLEDTMKNLRKTFAGIFGDM